MKRKGMHWKYKYCDLVIAEWDKQEMDFSIFKELFRVLKTGSNMACFYDVWKIGKVRESCVEAGFHQFRLCEWVKANPTPINSKRNYLSNAKEYFMYCVKGWSPTFNSEYDNGTYHAPLCHPPERTEHPTQKPLKLIKEIILKHTKPGDTILDCFAGAGTTAVAAKETGRNFVCFEINSSYCEIAKKRLQC
jgi:DNA modification methylase